MSWYYKNIGWIRCSLNYGRDHIERFCRQAMPFEKVLDIGAGSGDDLMLARLVNPGAVLHAVEVNPESARRLSQQGVIVYNINIERQKIPVRNGGFDLIIANQVLEHVKDIYWVFHEITRVLPIGGKIIIGVPNLASLHNRILLGLGSQPTCMTL